MKVKFLLTLLLFVFGLGLALSAENAKFRWYKIKYQCEMEKQYGSGFKTYETTIKVKKNQGQSHAEKGAVKEGMNRGCKKGTITIITANEEK